MVMAEMRHFARVTPSAFAGNAGEFFVVAELTRRARQLPLTARNNRAYDILTKRDDEFAVIRVKTKTSAYRLFQVERQAER